MICIGAGILLLVSAVIYGLYIVRDSLHNSMNGISAGLGIMFAFIAWLIISLFGVISILIGVLLRKW